MKTERRTPEASKLRKLFEEQWLRLGRIFSQTDEYRQQSPEEQQSIQVAIESVIRGTDKRLTLAKGYTKRLRERVHLLCSHVNRLVADIPEPVIVRKDDFGSNPYLNTFFVNSNEMMEFFSYNHDVIKFNESHSAVQSPDIYALLCMVKSEKKSYGPGLNGDMLVQDTPRTSINFESHNLFSLHSTEEQVRSSLKECLFNSYVSMIRKKIDEELKQEFFNPEFYLDALSKILQDAQQQLKIEKNSVTLNRMGLVITEQKDKSATEVELHEVELDCTPFRIIQLVRIPRNELLPPKDFLSEASSRLQM